VKYIPFLFILAGCGAGSPPADTPPKHTYEVTCPMNMTTVVVDTVRGSRYRYISNALEIFGNNSFIKGKQYPSTCVVKTLY
jgi:hypothetical protein